jgi:hypothetical protein
MSCCCPPPFKLEETRIDGDDRAGSDRERPRARLRASETLTLSGRLLSHSGAHVLTFFFLPSILASFLWSGVHGWLQRYITIVIFIEH